MRIKSALTNNLTFGAAFTLPSLRILDAASAATCWATCCNGFAKATGLVAFRLSSGPFTSILRRQKHGTAAATWPHEAQPEESKHPKLNTVQNGANTRANAPTRTDHSIAIHG